ncbi:hypothetical protein [Pseudomonas spirodelae]|uniref:DUF551 domain-containing protein n=1 Tax=Pseudomonas spirodelae TaxID=3101751 RepID=A0ABU5P912_9PSED|nr:hypothetical protein [Pseudomonas sp. T5W1]MEA1606126.1 hypothetical protein [Pseudomonas sp. T5W1]
MQAQTPEVSSEQATTPRYDTIVIKGAKGKNVPKEVDGGEVVAWSVGHGLAAMDALEEFVDDLAAGNCHQPAYLHQGAADAMNLMRRRRVLGWDADEPTGQPPADWKTAVALAVATAHHVFEDCEEEARNAIEYLAALMLASEPADITEQPHTDWTHNKPTLPGAYWIRGNLLRADALIEVKRVDDELWCNLHLVNTEHRIEYGFTIDQISPDFEWLGPLAPVQAQPVAWRWKIANSCWQLEEERPVTDDPTAIIEPLFTSAQGGAA